MTITDDQLSEWERLCEEATPGPWEADDLGVWAPKGKWVAETLTAGTAALAATSREALPALIAEVRRLRAAPRQSRVVLYGRERYVKCPEGKPYSACTTYENGCVIADPADPDRGRRWFATAEEARDAAHMEAEALVARGFLVSVSGDADKEGE